LGQNLHAVADVDMKTGHTGILSESGTIVKRSGGFRNLGFGIGDWGFEDRLLWTADLS
jgi:hypothetical protein